MTGLAGQERFLYVTMMKGRLSLYITILERNGFFVRNNRERKAVFVHNNSGNERFLCT
jgi:hypothetical protein